MRGSRTAQLEARGDGNGHCGKQNPVHYTCRLWADFHQVKNTPPAQNRVHRGITFPCVATYRMYLNTNVDVLRAASVGLLLPTDGCSLPTTKTKHAWDRIISPHSPHD